MIDFNVSLLNKSINFFEKKYYLTNPKCLNIVYTEYMFCIER